MAIAYIIGAIIILILTILLISKLGVLAFVILAIGALLFLLGNKKTA